MSFYLLTYVLATTQISTNEVRHNEEQTVSERAGGWIVDIGSDYTESTEGSQCSTDSIGIHRVET